MKRCLGKLPARHDPRTLMLARYLTSALPQPPDARDWSAKLSTIGMLANDRLGDCTIAGVAHLVQTWTSNNGPEIPVGDADVVAAYSTITGYTPSDPTSDRGACLIDVLNYWRHTDIVGGHTIGAYVSVGRFGSIVTDPTPLGPLIDEMKLAIDLFGGLYTGVMLPTSAMADVGGIWSRTDEAPGGLGGHCMALVGYDLEGVTYLTWGQRQRATWAWVAKYADEMYALLSPDWVSGATTAPSGFALAALQADLAQIGAAA